MLTSISACKNVLRGVVFLGFCLGLLIIGHFFAGMNRTGFDKKKFKLVQNEASRQYMTFTSMEDMDMSVFEPYLMLAVTPVDKPYLKELELPVDVIYYQEVNGKKEEALS